MTTENSSLIFGVRTAEAVANLEMLQRELDRTLAKFAAVQGARGVRGFSGSTESAAAATRTLNTELKHQGTALQRSSAQMVSYSQKVGKAFVPFRAELTAANTALRDHEKVVQRIAKDPSTTLGLARQRGEYLRNVRETSRIWEEQAKIRAAQARSGLAAVERAESDSRKRQLAALQADIRARSAIQAQVEKAHAAHLDRQAKLSMKYDAMTLSSRIRTLEQISRLQSRGYDSGRLITGYGQTAFADLANLSAYRQQAEAIRATNAAEADLARTRTNGITAVNGSTNALGRNTALMRETHSVARGLSGSLGSLWMTYGAIVPLLAGAVAGGLASQTFSTGRDIEYRLKMLEALGNQAANVNELMEAVHGSMKTPLEAAEGLQELAQAGLSTTEAMAALGPTLQLATLGSMSVADAALTTTAALATFNLQAYEAGRVGDIFAKGASISNTTVSGLAESMKQAGAAAATYGLTVEETVAQLTALAQSGIRGTAAGTAVKNAMTELYAPTKKASEMMKLINLEIYDADGNSRNYLDILKDLKVATSVLTEEQANLLLKGMFNERSRRAIQIYMNDMDRLIDMNTQLADSTGYLERANRMLLNTVEGASNRFSSVLQQSYVKAFQELNPLIRQTILAMEEFVSGEGFIQGVQTLGTVFSGVTSFLAEYIDVISKAVLAYGALRAAQLAITLTATAYGAAVTSKTAAVAAFNLALGTNTRAMAANTASTETAALAKNVLAGNTRAASAAASAAAISFTALNRALGIIGMVAGAASLAMYAFARDSDASARGSAAAGGAAEAAAAQIRNETAAILGRRRARLLELGVTDASVEADLRRRQQEIRDGEFEASVLEDRVRAAREDLANVPLWEVRTGASTRALALQKAEEELEKHNTRMSELAAEYQDITKTLAEGPAILQTGKMEDSLIHLIGEIERAGREITWRGPEHASSAMAPGLESLRSQAEGYLAAIAAGTPVAKEQVDGLNTAYRGLNQAITQTLQGTLGLTDPGPGGSGGLRLLNESFNHRKRLLEDMRDFQLRMLEDERKVGVKTSAQAAAERLEIWNEYQDKLVAAAQAAAAQMGASGAKEHAKELGVRAIQNKVAMERERAEQELQQASIKEMWENQKQGILLAHKARVDAAAVERRITKKQEEELKALHKAYLPARVVAQMEARNAVEEEYNKLIEERVKLLDKGTALDSDYANTEAGQKLAEAIRELTEASNIAGEQAAQRAGQLYDQTNSATAGAIRAIQNYADEALNASTQVEQAFSRAFSTLEDIFVEFALTGRLSFRSLVDGIQADLARLAVRQYVTGPIAQAMGLGGGGQQAQQGGGFNMPSGLGGGFTDTLSSGIDWVGRQIGSSSLQNFSAGLSGNIGSGGVATVDLIKGTVTGGTAASGTAAGQAGQWIGNNAGSIMGYAGAIYNLTQGNYGSAIGTSIGTYILPGIGTVIGSALGSLVDGLGNAPETRYGGGFHYQPGDTTAAYFGGPSGRDAGAENVIASMITDTAQSLQSIFDAIGSDVLVGVHGSAESSGKGRGGTASGGDLYIDGEIIASFGTIGKGTGFGGTSGSLEEMIQNLGVDLTHTFLEGLQAGAAFLPSTIQGMLDGIVPSDLNAEQAVAVAQHIQLVIEQVGAFQLAIESLPFANLRDLSFDAAANLISFAGGLENLDAGMTSYYQNFYSQEERVAWATEQMSKAFDSLGLTMPTLNDGVDEAIRLYRELVEAQDINTEAGQRGFAGLMNLAGAYSELANQIDGLSDQVVDTADVIGDSISNLQRLVDSLNNTLQNRNTAGALMDQIGGHLGIDNAFAPRREAELWSTLRETANLTKEIAYLQAYPDLALAYRQDNLGMTQSEWAQQHYQQYGQSEGRFFGPDYAKQVALAQELTTLVEKRIQDEARATQDQINNLGRVRDIARSLQAYLRSLESSDLAPYTLREKVGNAEAELIRLVSAARSGDESALGNVQGALQNALSLWREYGASGSDYQEAYFRLTGIVGDLAGSAVTEAERQIRELEGISQISSEQYALLNELYEVTRKATEELENQYKLELSAVDAQILALEALGLDTARLHDIAAILTGMPALIGAHMTSGNSYMIDNPDVLSAYQRGDFGSMSAAEAAKYHFETYGRSEGRTYIDGSHASGLHRVPFDGYIAELHQGERVLTAPQAYAMDAIRSAPSAPDMGIYFDRLEARLESLERSVVSATIGSSERNSANTVVGVRDAIIQGNRDRVGSARSKRRGTLSR